MTDPPQDVKASTSDAELTTLAAGDENLLKEFHAKREELRDELRRELVKIVVSHRAAIKRRDSLIIELNECGDSLRDIAAITGITHTSVANIIRQSKESTQ